MRGRPDPHRASNLQFVQLVSTRQDTVEALERVISKRDRALADLAAEHRRLRDEADRRYLNCLNDANDLYRIHLTDLKQRNTIAAEKTALIVKALADRNERYKKDSDAARGEACLLRAERNAARASQAQDRPRAFPGHGPAPVKRRRSFAHVRPRSLTQHHFQRFSSTCHTRLARIRSHPRPRPRTLAQDTALPNDQHSSE